MFVRTFNIFFIELILVIIVPAACVVLLWGINHCFYSTMTSNPCVTLVIYLFFFSSCFFVVDIVHVLVASGILTWHVFDKP